MSAPPYMRVWIAEYTADVQALSCEQDGAYWRLIRAMQRAGGKLPNKPEKLARICGLSLKRWQEIGGDVRALFKVRGGNLTHSRVSKELAHYEAVSEKRKQAALATDSEKPRQYKRKASAKAHANAKQLPTKPELEVSIEPIEGSISNRRDAPEARHEGASVSRAEPVDDERGWLIDAARAEVEELRCRRSDPDQASDLAEFIAFARERAATLRRARLTVVAA